MVINQADYCIVISNLTDKSEIGTLDECVTLLKKSNNIYAVSGISPFNEFYTQVGKLIMHISVKSDRVVSGVPKCA